MPLAFSDHVTLSPEVMFRAVGEESVILNLKTDVYLGLDQVATRMWVALTTAQSVQDAYNSLLAEFEVGTDELRQDLEEFLGQLLAQQLVELHPGENSASQALS